MKYTDECFLVFKCSVWHQIFTYINGSKDPGILWLCIFFRQRDRTVEQL